MTPEDVPAGVPALPPMADMEAMLIEAARRGDDEVIPALLRAGVDIEVRDPRGFTALVLATYNERESTTALLLAEGARVDGDPAVAANTPLIGVAFKGNLALARMLIEAGADVNRRNGAGQTALMTAALHGRGAMIDLLLAAGADRGVADDAGNTARSLAEAQGDAGIVARLGE